MRNRKVLFIGTLIIVSFIVYSVIYNESSYESEVQKFLSTYYSVSYEDYEKISSSAGEEGFEPLMQKGKYEDYFTAKGFEKFVANGQSSQYFDNVLDNKCNLRLEALSGDMILREDSFRYIYEAQVDIEYLESGNVVTKTEQGEVSGLLHNGKIKIEILKVYGNIFK